MPKNTRVHKMFDALRDKGMGASKAAKIAQSKTGQALATGRKPKKKGKR